MGMFEKLTAALVGAAVLGLTAAVSPANAVVITFDDLSAPAAGMPIPNGYKGLDWLNFYVLNAVKFHAIDGTNGYTNNMVSSPNVAYNGFGRVSEVLSSPNNFTVNSFDLGAAWNNNLNVVVEGLENGKIVDATHFVVNAKGPATQENLGWSGINELTFFSFGGKSAHYNGSGTQFVLDNLNLTTGVPEPATWAMLLLGIFGTGALLRSRRQQVTVTA